MDLRVMEEEKHRIEACADHAQPGNAGAVQRKAAACKSRATMSASSVNCGLPLAALEEPEQNHDGQKK